MTTFLSGGGGTGLTSCNSVCCHCELGSESLNEMLKPIQHDKEYSLALRERDRGLSSHKEMLKQVQHDENIIPSTFGAKEASEERVVRSCFRSEVEVRGVGMRVKAAFTLAEVLITLGIIGVVAAMTIPTLISNYQEKQTVSRLTKAYATISNAYTMAKVENGDLTSWGFAGNSTSGTTDPDTNTSTPAQITIDNTNLFLDKLSKHLKVSKRTRGLDINYTEYFLHGEPTTTTISTDSGDMLILTDGTTIKGGWISNYRCTTGVCGDFSIDINGPDTSPNAYGKDIFSFYIYKNGIVPMGKTDETTHPFDTECNPDNAVRYNGYGCTAWVIYNKNMDYLHCDDLSWEGKHKCN